MRIWDTCHELNVSTQIGCLNESIWTVPLPFDMHAEQLADIDRMRIRHLSVEIVDVVVRHSTA